MLARPHLRLGVARRGILGLGLVAVAFLSACGEDPTGPEQPIDGSWELTGIFSDEDARVQCWLSGSLELEQLPGGVNTVVGSGSYVLDCTADGVERTWEGSSALERGRLSGDYLSVSFGECEAGGRYDRSDASIIRDGVAVCEVSSVDLGVVFVVGSWEGHRGGTS